MRKHSLAGPRMLVCVWGHRRVLGRGAPGQVCILDPSGWALEKALGGRGQEGQHMVLIAINQVTKQAQRGRDLCPGHIASKCQG